MAIVDPWGGFNQGLSTLNSAITGMQDRQRQGRLDDMAMQQNQRAMRLSDLQYADLERRANEDQQRRDAIANTHGSTQYVPQQGMSLADIGAPSQGLPSQPMPWENQPQPTTGPQVGMDNRFTPPNTAAINARMLMDQGRTEEAIKAISLDDALAQYGAKVQAGGGDIRQFYEAKAKLDQGKEFFEAVKPFAKDPKTLKAMWPLLTKVYPQAAAIAPESLTETANGIATPVMTPDGKPVPGKYMLYDNDGKLHIVDNKPDPMEMMVKREELAGQRQDKQIAAADARLERTIAAGDRRAQQKANGPGKALPAGQLESIADMKRVKDVLGEAATEFSKIDTGPVTGRLQAIGSKVGMASDDFVNVQQKLQTAQNIMLKLRSGAAVTESEYNRFLKEFPTPNDPPSTRDRKMQNTVQYFDTLMNEKMDIYEEGGYKVPRQSAGSAKPAQAFDNMPSPKQYAGKTMRDTKSGQRFQSDGKTWKRVQ